MPFFEPPIVYANPAVLPNTRGTQRALFKYYGPYPVGQSVIKVGGVYKTITSPDQLTLLTATEIYMGGHIYEISSATAAALVAAGYTVAGYTSTFGSGTFGAGGFDA